MIKQTRILFVGYLILVILASTLLKSILWGENAWSAASVTFGATLALMSLLLLNRKINGKAQGLIPEKLFVGKWITIPVFITLLVMMWYFRYGHDYWGERQEIATAVSNGITFRPGAPLAMFLNWLIFRAINSTLFWNAVSSSSLLSVLCGGSFILASASVSRILHEDGKDAWNHRFLSTLFIISNGFFVLFFGGGGNMPPVIVLTLFFIISSILHIRGKVSLYLPAILFIFSVLTHMSSLYLLPGFLYILIRNLRVPGPGKHTVGAIVILLVGWSTMEVVLKFFQGMPGLSSHFLTTLENTVLPFFQGKINRPFATWGNSLLIIGPSSIVAVIMLVSSFGKKRSSERKGAAEENFLATLTVSALVLLLFGVGRIDSGLRWDLFAVAGPAFAVYSLWALKGRLASRSGFGYAAVLLVTAGIFHTLPMIASNYSPLKGQKLILSHPLAPGRAEKIVGIRYFETENYVEAAEWLNVSAEKNDRDDVTWFKMGMAATYNEKDIDAISFLIKAVRLKPDNLEYMENLAEAYINKRWMKDAAYELEKLVQADSMQVRYWTRLGYARNHGGMLDGAIKAYETALAFDPENDLHIKNLTSALLNKGAQLQKEIKFKEAEGYYYRVKRLYPLDWIGSNNLALMAMEVGDFQKAHDILSNALGMNDQSAKLHFNMGLVEEELGNYQKAFDHLRRSSQLSRGTPPPNDHIERVWKKIQEQK